MTKEQKFYKALQDVFIGAKIEGQGGFVNLMKIKSNYYRKIEDILKKDIEAALKSYPKFRDELFDKLYSFFSRYFSRSGSIYFNYTPFHQNVYDRVYEEESIKYQPQDKSVKLEKVYSDDKDVMLFWKTHMLYYVKSDRIFNNLLVEFNSYKFFFDVSKLEYKKANEKRSLIYELKEIKEDRTIVFTVLYSEKGTKTKQDEILKAIKRKGIAITEEQLERAFRAFEKQSEVDFFINKNAKAFLQEQFKLWSYQYFWEGAKEWSADRVNELQILKDIAFKIIDFISQFEDELVKIWNKPKFVKNSNYVITLDRIVDKKLVEKIKRHKNYKEQVKEWKELGIDQDNSKAPIDTKYFKDLEIEILSQFDDLDQSLDGWLIKSENYQALNTILPKFKEKVQTIYIDPPFNTGNDFPYIDRFQDSSWLSLMSNRVEIAKNLLYKKGGLFLHLDWNANFLGRLLLDNILGEENFRNEIVWAYTGAGTTPGQFPRKHDNILWFSKSEDILFNSEDLRVPYKKSSASAGKTSFTGKADEETLRKLDERGKLIEDWWSDIGTIGYAHSQILGFETQKPERLLQRIIISNSNKDDFIMDFFLGSGTTTAVAHKLGRKWLGVEMGEHFYSVILPRMKNVLAYDKSGISKEVNEYQGGGFFKYYELEQYEEALANCKYEDSDLFNSPSKTPYQEYVFMKDEKMLNALEIDYEEEKVKVDLNKLYSDIDIAETLSNLTGKWIKKINDGEVEFEDGMKINTKDLDYKLIKPLIWWE